MADLTLAPTPAPAELGPGQIRVQIRAAGLNSDDVAGRVSRDQPPRRWW
ncbi:hypothetical protein [Mycobacterium ulcerans]|nr:hypothetical protein [Mycobacterium ulcerans]UDM33599.1 hypothetical protein LH162_18865 [Mycobacterium ulcerans]